MMSPLISTLIISAGPMTTTPTKCKILFELVVFITVVTCQIHRWLIENATPFFWCNQACMLYTCISFTCHLLFLGSLLNFNSYNFVSDIQHKIYSTLNFHLHLLIQCRFLFHLHSFFQMIDIHLYFFKMIVSFLDILRTFNDFFKYQLCI